MNGEKAAHIRSHTWHHKTEKAHLGHRGHCRGHIRRVELATCRVVARGFTFHNSAAATGVQILDLGLQRKTQLLCNFYKSLGQAEFACMAAKQKSGAYAPHSGRGCTTDVCFACCLKACCLKEKDVWTGGWRRWHALFPWGQSHGEDKSVNMSQPT